MGDTELTCRVYTGQPSVFGLIRATEGSFDLVLLTELTDGGWIVTGLADGIETRLAKGTARPNVDVENMDEPLKKILAAHAARVKDAASAPAAAPASLADAVAAYDRFLEAAFG
jgi:hypothetical protein